MKRKKLIAISVTLLGIVAFFAYRYAYQPHRDIESEAADFTLNATDLIQEFSQEPNEATQKYLDKTLLVSGKITASETQSVTLDNGVFATFATPLQTSTESVVIKGRCIGYDELLEEVRLDQCSFQF